MIIFPAIDVLDNKAVRLLYGDRNKCTIYGTPAEVAKRWVDLGAEYLHIVDLNGAFGEPEVNRDTLKELLAIINIPMQLGGGVRSIDKVKYYIDELGATRVIIGTTAVKNPEVLVQCAEVYGNKIVCGIDAKDGKVAIKGWQETSSITPLELALYSKKLGVDTVLYTDISRDGALTGVNIEATYSLQEQAQMNVIASGGIAKMSDIIGLKKKNIYGAITGKAIYSGSLDLAEALELARG